MSGQFSAGQFNDAFQAKRLRNWQYGINHPGKYPNRRKVCATTEFIADCNGHLLPHIPRNSCSSPWGDYRTCIWEETSKCDCVDRVRHPQDYEKLPKFFKKQSQTAKPPPKRPCGVKPAIDPILNQLRESRLPIIWMIGLPTERIQGMREKFCEELAEALEYEYINLDHCIEEWTNRQNDSMNYENQENIIPPSYIVQNQRMQHHHLPRSHPHQQYQKTMEDEFNSSNNISVPAQLSPSLTEQVIEYDKTPNRTALAYVSHINTHRQGQRQRKTKQSSSKLCLLNPGQYDPLTGDKIEVQQPGNLIQFTVGQKFTRDKIMELLKFAMIESLPTKGFIIDGVFLDQGDGICFEKMFYSPAVCTYFTESFVNNSIDEWNRARTRPPAQDLLIDKQIKSTVQLIFPKLLRRNKKYSFLEVDKLCRMFETKMIRVLNAEEANQETIHFVYSLLHKHIKNYPNHMDEPKLNFFDQDGGEESDAFLSPRNSVIAVPIRSDEEDDIQDETEAAGDANTLNNTLMDPIEQEFQKILSKQLPVIWILGLKQLSTDPIRQKFCEMLASQMNFTFINMDREIINWYDFDEDTEGVDIDMGCGDGDVTGTEERKREKVPVGVEDQDQNDHDEDDEKVGDSPMKTPRVIQSIRPKIQETAHKLVKRIVNNNDLLSQEEVLELVKYAMMLAPQDTSGFIIDEFPVNRGEGETFEKEIYPATSLIYFLNFTWTVNKTNDPPVEIPQYFRRVEPYSEEQVEQVCDLYGYKAIKVWNAEDLDEEGMTAINNIIHECINASNHRPLAKGEQSSTTHNQNGGENSIQNTPRTVDPRQKKQKNNQNQTAASNINVNVNIRGKEKFEPKSQQKTTTTTTTSRQSSKNSSNANIKISPVEPSAPSSSHSVHLTPPLQFRASKEQQRQQGNSKRTTPNKMKHQPRNNLSEQAQYEQSQNAEESQQQQIIPKSPVIDTKYTRQLQERRSLNSNEEEEDLDEIEIEYNEDDVEDDDIMNMNTLVEIESLPKTPNSDYDEHAHEREVEEEEEIQEIQQPSLCNSKSNNRVSSTSKHVNNNNNKNNSNSNSNSRGKIITNKGKQHHHHQQQQQQYGRGHGDTDEEVKVEIYEDDQDPEYDDNYNDEVIDMTQDFNDAPEEEDDETLILINTNSHIHSKSHTINHFEKPKTNEQNSTSTTRHHHQDLRSKSKPEQRNTRQMYSTNNNNNYRRSGGGDY